MTTIETDRLLIRNFRVDDWEVLRETILQYEASEFAAYDHQWPTCPDELRKIAEWFAGGDSYLAVCLKDTGRFIRFVSLNREQNEGSREFNLGYVFNFDYHGKGYATEACRAAVTHSFDQLQADRVVTGTAADNHASCRLLQKLGLRKTGQSRGSFQNTPDGKPMEFIGYTFAITRDEWNADRRDKGAG